MKTLLNIAALITATATPVSFVLEAHGTVLPTAVSSSYLFGAFVVVVTVLTLITDYRGATLVRCEPTTSTVPTKPQSRLALAA